MKPPRKSKRLDLTEIWSQREQSDVLGSYTGTPVDPEDDVPEQDVDDL